MIPVGEVVAIRARFTPEGPVDDMPGQWRVLAWRPAKVVWGIAITEAVDVEPVGRVTEDRYSAKGFGWFVSVCASRAVRSPEPSA